MPWCCNSLRLSVNYINQTSTRGYNTTTSWTHKTTVLVTISFWTECAAWTIPYLTQCKWNLSVIQDQMQKYVPENWNLNLYIRKNVSKIGNYWVPDKHKMITVKNAFKTFIYLCIGNKLNIKISIKENTQIHVMTHYC